MDSNFRWLCNRLDIRPRNIIDNLVNAHDKRLTEFPEAKCCVLNGKFDTENDNFTCLHLGKSVVEYCMIAHEFLYLVWN